MTGILWAIIQSPLLISPRYPLGSPHHITLQYGVNLTDWQYLLNKEFQATCLYEAALAKAKLGIIEYNV